MLNPVHANIISWFYPVGNTPAIDLLQYQTRKYAPSKSASAADKEEDHDTVRVLLLACGDPRSLLFSLWCRDVQGSEAASKSPIEAVESS